MGTTQYPIIAGADVPVPAELAEIIATHRGLFAGWKMEAAPTDYLDRLTAEYDNHLAAIDSVQRSAVEAGKDLSDEQDAECQRHQDEAEKLVPQIERWSKLRQTRADMVTQREAMPPAPRIQITERTTPEASSPASGEEQPVHRSAGDYTVDLFHASRGDVAARERVQRALAKVMTTDTPGLLPTTHLADVKGKLLTSRPLVALARKLPLPASGMSFRRPRITQHTAVGVQTTEKTQVATRALKVEFDDFDFQTFAGAVNMSIQEMERTTPGAVDLAFEDLAGQYAIQTEDSVATKLEALAASGGAIQLADADEDAVLGAIYGASGEVYRATGGRMANAIVAGLGWWGKLGALTKPINPQNALASGDPTSFQMRIGPLQVTVAPELDDNYLAVGHSDYLEVVENGAAPVQLRALEVGIRCGELGVYGLFGSKVDAAGWRRIDAAPAGGNGS